LKKSKLSFGLIFIAVMIGIAATESSAYPPFLFKAKKFGAKDCTFCHVNAEGGPPWNDRGKWLIQEKEKRKADLIDVEWLAEYKPTGNSSDSLPLVDPKAAPSGTGFRGGSKGVEISAGPVLNDTATGDAVNEFVNLEREWMKAVARHDEEAVKRFMADDFTLTSAYSTGDLVTREQFLKNIQSVQQNELTFSDARVKFYGDVAILKARIKDNYRMNGEDRSGDYLITDVWVKHDGRWQVVTRHSSIPMKPQPK